MEISEWRKGLMWWAACTGYNYDKEGKSPTLHNAKNPWGLLAYLFAKKE